MGTAIVRNNEFTQEKLIVRAFYPEIFDRFQKLFDKEEITAGKVEKQFRKLCEALCADLTQRHASLENPAAARSGGRLTKAEERIRNDFRRNVYVLMQDLEGLKWWPFIKDRVERTTPGKRTRSALAKNYTYLMHYILESDETGSPAPLDSAAISDMANQLAYAHRHDVPFQFLIGFLYEVRFDQAAENERQGKWEVWHPRKPWSGQQTVQPSGEL